MDVEEGRPAQGILEPALEVADHEHWIEQRELGVARRIEPLDEERLAAEATEEPGGVGGWRRRGVVPCDEPGVGCSFMGRVSIRHIVRPGEHLSAIAARNGFRSDDTVWNAAENEELRRLR